MRTRIPMIYLDCAGIVFCSQLDERHLFVWAMEIPGTLRWEQDILVVRKNLSQTSIRDLLALFSRYQMPMAQLAQFRTTRNEGWFAAPEMYWHARVFGKGQLALKLRYLRVGLWWTLAAEFGRKKPQSPMRTAVFTFTKSGLNFVLGGAGRNRTTDTRIFHPRVAGICLANPFYSTLGTWVKTWVSPNDHCFLIGEFDRHRFRQKIRTSRPWAAFLFLGGSEQGACAPCV
jgi:hypothetical protein